MTWYAAMFTQKCYSFGLFPELACDRAVRAVCYDLYEFFHEFPNIDEQLITFIAMFRGPAIESEQHFEDLLWSPRIASGGPLFKSRQKTDYVIRLWDASTGESVGVPWEGHKLASSRLTFSRDGRGLIVCEEDYTLRFRDIRTGEAYGPAWRGLDFPATAVVLSPDGDRIAASAGDGVRVWNAQTGDLIGSLRTEHKLAVSSIVFTPDGRRIVSGSEDSTLRLWDATTGQPIGGAIEGHPRVSPAWPSASMASRSPPAAKTVHCVRGRHRRCRRVIQICRVWT